MQHLKKYQDDLTVAFTNPLFAVLLWVCPWHPRAKQAKATFLQLIKVPPNHVHLSVCVHARVCVCVCVCIYVSGTVYVHAWV